MFAALASCVFLWGLQYKLSLYDPPQSTSHQAPTAKLLSWNEQSERLEASNDTRTEAPTKVPRASAEGSLFILLIASIFCLPAFRRSLEVEYASLQLMRALLETNFVRPPPSLN